jgi:hypothetical protein
MGDTSMLEVHLRAALASVTFDYRATTHLVGAEPDLNGTCTWVVTGSVALSEEDRSDAWVRADGIGLHTDEFDSGAPLTLDIFQMEGLTVDLWQVGNLQDALDARSADTAHFLPLAEGVSERGALSSNLDAHIHGAGGQLVLIDRVLLAPAWRGKGGVGRLLIGSVLQWIAADAQCVAVHPHPFHLADLDSNDPALDAGIAAVRHTWGFLGFVPFLDDLYIFDPTSNALDQAMGQLRARLL